MDNGVLILIVLFSTIVISALIQIVLYKNRKKQKAIYTLLWNEFNNSKNRRLYKDSIYFGNKLIFNTHLTQEHLKIIH